MKYFKMKSLTKITSLEISVDNMTSLDKMITNIMFLYEMTIDTIPLYEMTEDKLFEDVISVNEMPVHELIS